MMKRSCLFILLTVLLCLCLCAHADEACLTIPAGTTAIETEAFYGDSSLQTVILPEGLLTIGPRAFADSGVMKVNLPQSLTEIADDAFDGCEGVVATVVAGSAGETFVKAQGIEYRYDRVASPVEDFEYEIVDGEVTITGYLGDGGDVVVPGEIEGCRVAAIGEGAFSHTYSITSITLPEGITSIPDYAFNQSSLISISIPDSVTSIGTSAFQSCPSLYSITIPDHVTSIDYNAFRNCINLTEVYLPASLSSTGEYAFADCQRLSTVHLANGITAIDDGSFYNCTDLTGITLPESLTTIGGSSFSQCSNLKSITLPKMLTSIGISAFSECTSLKQIVFPEGLTEVKHWTFENCSSLNKVEFSTTITTIMDGAFTNCDSLSALSIPGNVAGIANNAFRDCDNITSVIITDGLSSIGSFTFSDCDKLENIELPNTLTWIGSSAFSNCKSLNSIVLPDNLNSLGYYAFSDCSNLTNVTLPKNLEVIEDGVFQNCIKLTSITLPPACWKIENYAFDGCSALSSVSFPDGANTFGAFAFADCTSLTGITIRKWSSIGEGAFSGCSSLRVVHLDEPNTLANYAFANCTNLQKAYIHYLWGTLQPEIFANCPNLTIHGEPGSYAETYANENGIPFSTDPFPPQAPSFTMDTTTVSTGVEVTFHVQSADASMVQLVVDGSNYDMKVVTDGTAVLTRAFTLAGEREVAFRAYSGGVWGEPCTAQTLLVEATDQLDSPVVTCNEKIWVGDSLTVSWEPVENATGYTIYLTDVSGYETSWEYGTNLRTLTIPAHYFTSTGSCNVLVMAYGAGYSQSSTRVYITVTDEFIPWTGYVQYPTTNTYSTSDCTTVNGYVDYIDPVTVLDEENGAYLIEMTLTSGGTAQRWVVKSAIGKAPYAPDLTLETSYSVKNDQVILRAKTNLQGVKAGVLLNNATLGSSSYPQNSTTYTRTFSFSIAAPSVATTYTLWAEDASGHRITADVTIPAYQAPTPTPEVTVTPTPVTTATPSPLPSDEPVTTPEPTIAPEDSSDEEEEPIVLPSQPQATETPASCEHYENGVHKIVLADLKDMSLLCLDDGRLQIVTSTCTKCGAAVEGYVPEETTMQFYFHPLLKYYDTSANGAAYAYFSSYKSLLCNAPLTVSTDINVNGASLHVSGKLTVEGHLNNVSSIRCAELEIKEGGRISMVNGGSVNASGKITIHGVLTGADYIQCSNRFYVGSSGTMAMVPAFTLKAGGTFEFHSNADHSAYFSEQSHITAAGMKIRGNRFQFDGIFVSTDRSLDMANTDSNYVSVLDLTPLGGLIDYNYTFDKLYSTLPSSTSVCFDSLLYELYTNSARFHVFDTQEVIYDIMGNLRTPMIDSNGEVDEDFYTAAVQEELDKEYGVQKPVYEVTLNFATTDGPLADEAVSIISEVLEEEQIFYRSTDKNGIIKLGSVQYGLYTISDSETVQKSGKTWEVEFKGMSSILSSSATSDVSKVEMYSGTVTCITEGSTFRAGYVVTSTPQSLQDAAASIINIGEAEFNEIKDGLLRDVLDDAAQMLVLQGTVEAMSWIVLGDEFSSVNGDLMVMKNVQFVFDNFFGMYEDAKEYSDAAQNVVKYHN